MIEITSVPFVNGQNFGDWVNTNRSYWGFPHSVIVANFSDIFRNIQALTGKSSLNLDEFLGLFLFIYNETGGTFRSMSEIGSREYIESASGSKRAYTWKEKGRGLNQLTSAANYRVVLQKLGYNYDSLTAEQLDDLFLKPSIYYPAFKIYITDTQLAGNAFKRLGQNGEFYQFGRAISGGQAYGNLLAARAATVKTSLKDKQITSERFSPKSQKIAGVAAISLVGLLMYPLLSGN